MAIYDCPGDSDEFFRKEMQAAMKRARTKERNPMDYCYKGKPEGTVIREEVLYQHGKPTSNVIPFRLKRK